ncbi:hypothetical protein BDC45DRAFT_350155 [Circinella umbellata]|nr:hypothetical protein BDC45DRAFT_350155 [Circinella umbellata]
MSQQIDELELQLQEYERANNQSRWNEQALEAHLSVWETYSTRSNKIMGELYEACSGRWLLFERLSRNSLKKNNALVKRLQISLRGTVQHIRQIVTKMNDLDASFNSNKEPITLDTVLAMTEESFLTTERYRFEGVQQYLEYMRATEEVEMLKHEAVRIVKNCSKRAIMVDNAVQHARDRVNKGDEEYLKRIQMKVLSWKNETFKNLERLPSSVRPDTNININVHNNILQNNIQNSTMYSLVDTSETDETLFGEEEGGQTIEDLYAVEAYDNSDSDMN